MSAAPPPALYAAWLHAQRSAIAQMGEPRARERSAAQLATLLNEIKRSPPAPGAPGTARLAAAARRELATPGRYRLRTQAPAPRTTWWQLLWGAVVDRWRALIRILAKQVRFGGSLRTTLGDILILVFLGIVGVAVAQLARALQFRRDRHLSALVPLQSGRSARSMFERAEAAAQAGDFALAIRMLFAATVALLDLRGVLHDDASATVNELRAALGKQPRDVEASFVDIAREFTRAAYAERPVRPEDWQAARDSYHALAQRIAST